MPRFVLTEETQLLRSIDLHNAAREMACGLGISGQIETRAGDYRKTGWSVGWTGKPGDHDVLLEVYAAPLTPYTLSVATENEVLRAKVRSIAGAGADESAIEAYREFLRERDRRAKEGDAAVDAAPEGGAS
jgi:hypothetical protein